MGWRPAAAAVAAVAAELCRNEARVQQAVRQVEQAGSGSGGSARGYTADLASLSAVRRLADQVRQDCPRLDVLINNAGVYEQQLSKSHVSRQAANCWHQLIEGGRVESRGLACRNTSAAFSCKSSLALLCSAAPCCCLSPLQDGLEMTWAVNVAAPFLLTACLLDVVAERVVNVSSISAASSIDFGNLQQVPQLHCACAASLPAYLAGCWAMQQQQ